jgi:subtilisin-like proprotein convertase family protein
MQRKQILYLLAIVALLVSMLPLGAAAQEAPPAPFQIVEVAAPDNKAMNGSGAAGSSVPLFVPDGMAFFNETEPNDTAATANALPGSQAVVYGNIPAGDYDYFSFTANAGDRVYAAVQTQWSNASGDSRLDVMASDGTTSLEFDDDNGSFSSLASAIGGTIIPAAGTYYVRVYGYSATTVITPYYLHVRVQSGTPAPEVEPNNDLITANPLPASGWVSGNIAATTDPDFFSFTLNAGDSVFLGLDMDPDRATSNTNWNGRLGLGIFAGNQILVVNDGSTTKPHAEAFFMTVQQAGTYYAYVDSTSTTGLGANARYHLSVSIYPKAVQTNCTTFTSTDVPVTIGPGVGTATSTIVVPSTVTSAIQDINATIVLTHSIMADLDVTLLGPTAVSVPLFTDVGSTATGGQTQMNVGLDDQAALPIGPYPVVSGMVNQPEQPGRLAGFNGTPATGTWTLQLADDTTNTSGGRLQSWSLEVCGDPPPPYAIELNKTVGTEPGQCAVGDTITVPAGGATVYYCYTVRNIGLNTVTTHDLVDSELGALLTGVTYSLVPGATYSFIQQATVDATVTNTATWTAGDGVGVASDSDTATVNVAAPLCPAGFDDVILDVAVFDTGFPPTGWTVTNTSTGCVAPGVPQWTNTNPGNRLNLTGGVGPFAIADSDRCGLGSTLDTIMTTGLLDFTGLISPTVSFNSDYDDIGVGGDQALLDVSTDGGATWSNLITWDSDQRGPRLVTQALTGAAGENDAQVRWHYAQGTYDWWWQVDSAFLTACEPLVPAISLDKTVGTDPLVCATTDEITLPAGGGNVTYCYEVENTGNVTLNLHDLDDSELGNLFSGLNYALTPGASVFVTQTTPIAITTVNAATWTAYNLQEPPVQATDVATVTVEVANPAIALDKTVGTDPLTCATTDEITLPAGGGDVTYCYEVENTGNVTLNLHDLDDSELGNIFSGLTYALAPGASVFVTETTNIAVTTVNTATWTAYNVQEPPVQATDAATVTVQAANNPAIELNKTVGTVPAVCAATNQISVPYGTSVYYCYQIENTGSVTMTVHSLVDDQLGTLATNLPYVLPPGAFSPQVIVADTAVVAVTNTATWTAASGVGYTVNTNAAFNYVPINTTGTGLALADDGEANITIPWAATFFGVTSSNLRVGNNGGILFNATTGEVGITNAALPNAAHPLALFPFWDDMDSDTGDVYWEVQGTTPNRMLIVEWYNRPHFSNVGSATFR